MEESSQFFRAIERAPLIGFGRYIITATTRFLPEDLVDLRVNAPLVVRRRVPEYEVGVCASRLEDVPQH